MTKSGRAGRRGSDKKASLPPRLVSNPKGAPVAGTEHICEVCGSDCSFICERCLRCEHCCAEQDKKRQPGDQHLGKWIWSRQAVKGVKLRSLVTAGHGKGD